MSIENTTLMNAAAQVITTGAGTQGNAITTMYICNIDATQQTFNMYLVPSGGTASNSNIIYYNKSIAAGDTYVMDMEKLFLGPGDTLRANSSVSSKLVASVSSIGV